MFSLKALLLLCGFFVLEARAQTVGSLTVWDRSQVFRVSADEHILTPQRTKRCEVFKYRLQQLVQINFEMELLLETITYHRRPFTKREVAQFTNLRLRLLNIHDQLRERSIRVTHIFRFATPIPDWIKQKNYELILRNPMIHWFGTDASEPISVSLEILDNDVNINYDLTLGEFCYGDRFDVELVSLHSS